MLLRFVGSKSVFRPERFSTVFAGERDSVHMSFHMLDHYSSGLSPLGSFTTNSADRGPVSTELDILLDHLLGHFCGGIVRIN